MSCQRDGHDARVLRLAAEERAALGISSLLVPTSVRVPPEGAQDLDHLESLVDDWDVQVLRTLLCASRRSGKVHQTLTGRV